MASFIHKIFGSGKERLLFPGMVDRHCHLLPGVDDGVKTMDESLAILANYEQMGIAEAWLTPHIMEDVPNITTLLRERYEELLSAYSGNVQLHLAAENMMDKLFLDRLEKNDVLPLTIGNNKYLLVETSYFNPPLNLNSIFEEIKSKGFYPLLAHPERYNYITSPSEYKKLRDRKVKFQVNLLSFSGHYGPLAAEKAMQFLKDDMIDCVATDVHRQEHLDKLQNMRLPKKVAQRINTLIAKTDI